MANEILDNDTLANLPLKYIEYTNQRNFAVARMEYGVTRGNVEKELEEKGYSDSIAERVVADAVVFLRAKRKRNGRNELWTGILLVVVCLPLVFFVRHFMLAGVVAGVAAIIKGVADLRLSKATI